MPDPSSSTSATKSNDRQRFTVELRPGETTVVSWKKLIKEANKANGSAPHLLDPTTSIPPPLQGLPSEANLKDEPPANRFNAVIEKIERLYKGNDSSDDDMNDVMPDDDQYDTEDSFIDDAELDEYFQVDNCSTKHNGFFVNKGKLEAVKESPVLPMQKPKKRRRNDISLAMQEDGPLRKKHVKPDKVSTEATSLASKKITQVSPGTSAAKSVHLDDRKHVKSTKKKSADSTMDHTLSSKPSNVTSLVGQIEPKIVIETQKNEQQLKIPRVKDTIGNPEASRLKTDSRSHTDLQSDRKLYSVDRQVQSNKHKTKSSTCEMKETHISGGKHAQGTNTLLKKDGCNVKTKATMVEKAIKELERMVEVSRAPPMEVQDADMAGQAVKKRLPRDQKQMLAKIARLAQGNDGEVSEDVVNRLMGFLGHTMQLRTLKRNLRTMISSGLSDNQEKERRFHQIKREAIELITKDLEQQARTPDSFLEVSDGKEANKKKYTMSIPLEDKICDIYDLYTETLEGDSASLQLKQLYIELAQLWPNGLMDTNGIKRGICKSKDRNRSLHQQQKDSLQIKKKKSLTPKLVDKGTLGTTSSTQHQAPQALEKETTDSGHHVKSFSNNYATVSTLALEAPRANAIINEKLKKEKVKSNPNSDSVDDVRAPLVKKKLKRVGEGESGKVFVHPEKLHAHVDDRIIKPQKPQLPVIAQRSSSSHSSSSAGP